MMGNPIWVVSFMIVLLRVRPDLFPDGEKMARELEGKQRRALRWQEFGQLLATWSKNARLSYVAEQAGAMEQIVDLLKRLDLEDRLWLMSITDDQFRDPAWLEQVLAPRFARQLAPLRVSQELAAVRTSKPRTSRHKDQAGPAKVAGAATGRKSKTPGPKKQDAKRTLLELLDKNYKDASRK